MTKFSVNVGSLTVFPSKGRSGIRRKDTCARRVTARAPRHSLTLTSDWCIYARGEQSLPRRYVSKVRTRTSWTRSRAPPKRSSAHPWKRSGPSNTTGREQFSSGPEYDLKHMTASGPGIIPHEAHTPSRPAVEPGDACMSCRHPG